MKNPIDKVEWRDARNLNANSYNPNVVLKDEMRLLEFSLLKTGWLHPILIDPEGVIIDGFHRVTLTRSSAAVAALSEPAGRVPVIVLDLPPAERKLLTIRINRAKGVHVALKMGDLIKSLHHEHGLSLEAIGQGIGADKAEVELLLQEGVFKALKVHEHQWSKAWVPA